jgi:hypothetical protein
LHDPEKHERLAKEDVEVAGVDYRDVSRAELEQRAKDAGVPRASELSKPELAEALMRQSRHAA